MWCASDLGDHNFPVLAQAVAPIDTLLLSSWVPRLSHTHTQEESDENFTEQTVHGLLLILNNPLMKTDSNKNLNFFNLKMILDFSKDTDFMHHLNQKKHQFILYILLFPPEIKCFFENIWCLCKNVAAFV